MEVILHKVSRDSNNSKKVLTIKSEEINSESENSQVYLKNSDKEMRYIDTIPIKNRFNLMSHTNFINIVFEDITFSPSMRFRKVNKEILHKINGHLPEGQLIAIMGPSGAGKSTLLNVLSGYSVKGVSGNIYVNGFPRNLKTFRKVSCYITQDDRLEPLLTVLENMSIAADLKLGTKVSQTEKQALIEEILDNLGLREVTNTRTSRLSGGQRKRLSIAMELVNNPLIMFLDEPTTGLDSSSCGQCVKLLKVLAQQGRTIICTIHQPSAAVFEIFDQIYVLASGRCLYQGSPEKLIPFLKSIQMPCPKFHNPADYVIELACAEYGVDKVNNMVMAAKNGRCSTWLEDKEISSKEVKRQENELVNETGIENLEATSQLNQLKVLLRRGFLKSTRDLTLTYLRIGVNIVVSLMLGTLYWKAGSDGSKVIDNYNLLFSILMHHMMSTMMLTILTFPSEMWILIKEHFNRWYSLKIYYLSITIIDIPISMFGCLIFTIIIYLSTEQPLELGRLAMFTCISILTVFVAQSFGLMIGAIFDVINGTFLGPTLSVPMMMFAGFGVTLRDLPVYLQWGSYISYLRYGLEGLVGAIYGLNRQTIDCPKNKYCHYRYPTQFLEEISMRGDQFWNDIIALLIMLFFLRIVAYVLLKWKLISKR